MWYKHFTPLCLLFFLGCHPNPAPLPPKPPIPELLLGTNHWRLSGEGVRLAISPSGTKLAIVEERSIKVIDLSRNVLMYQGSSPARPPRQADSRAGSETLKISY